MSSIFESENLGIDFREFQEALVKTNDFKFVIEGNKKIALKKYHRLTYVIALFEGKVETKWVETNKFLFLSEIRSDLLANSSLCFLGFYHSSEILIRRLIENFYNHIFYFEHPVEFELLNLGRNEYTPIVDLKKYYESHPVVKPLTTDKNIKDFNDHIFQHYQELCKIVHTKGEQFMGLAKNLEEIKPSFNLSTHLDSINKSLQCIIYLLYKFHRDLVFTNVEKTLIAKSFNRNLRGTLLL